MFPRGGERIWSEGCLLNQASPPEAGGEGIKSASSRQYKATGLKPVVVYSGSKRIDRSIACTLLVSSPTET